MEGKPLLFSLLLVQQHFVLELFDLLFEFIDLFLGFLVFLSLQLVVGSESLVHVLEFVLQLIDVVRSVVFLFVHLVQLVVVVEVGALQVVYLLAHLVQQVFVSLLLLCELSLQTEQPVL